MILPTDKKRFTLLAVLFLMLTACATSSETGAATAISARGVMVLDNDLLVGRPTDNSAAISVRVSSDQTVYLEYGNTSGDYTNQTPVQSLAAGDLYTYEVEGLDANAEYFYRLRFKKAGEDAFAIGTEYSFDTQKSRGATFNFAIQADPHLGAMTRFQKWCGPRCTRERTDDKIYAITVNNMLAREPDFMLDLGDTFMTAQNHMNGLFDIQNRERGADITQAEVLGDVRYLRDLFAPIGSSAPVMLVQGNHEAEDSARLDGTPDNLAVWAVNARKEYFPSPTDNGFYSGSTTEYEFIGRQDGYYAWEWGDALFIALDPFWTKAKRDVWARTLGREQYDWLKETLEGSDAKFKFVFLHHLIGGLDNPYGSSRGGALYADYFEWGGRTPFDVEKWDQRNFQANEEGPEGRNNEAYPVRKVDSSTESYDFDKYREGWGVPIQQMLIDNGVQIVFHGHDHVYAKEVHPSGLIYQEVPMPAVPSLESNSDELSNRETVLLSAARSGYDTIDGVIIDSSGFLNVTVMEDKVTVEYVKTIDNCTAEPCSEIADSYTVEAPQ